MASCRRCGLSRLLGLGVLALALLIRGERPRLPVQWWPALALQGGLDAGAFLTLFIGTAGAGAALAVVASAPFAVVTVVLARFLLCEAISPVQWSGIALVVAGVTLLAASS